MSISFSVFYDKIGMNVERFFVLFIGLVYRHSRL